MQANCCIFPAPKQFQLTKIINKILLIPKKPTQTTPMMIMKQNQNIQAHYYMDKYIHNNLSNENNQFMVHLGQRNLVLGGGNSNGHGNFSYNNSTTEDTEKNRMKKFDIYSNMKLKASKSASQLLKNTPMLTAQKLTHQNIRKISSQIPCIFLPSSRLDKLLIFFHGNGEDLSSCYDFGYFINSELGIAVLIVEYQGYSIYEGDTTPKTIIEDTRVVMEFLFSCGYRAQDIILFGRSIGGAIAFETASQFQPCCLLLLSPFLSLKKVTEDLYGRCISSLLKQTLDNATIAQSITCPILIIHGLKDNLVPYHHSISILKQCKGYTRLKLVENMTHIKFNFRQDFVVPVRKFLGDLGIVVVGDGS